MNPAEERLSCFKRYEVSRYCRRGHDKDTVGTINYQCRECRRQLQTTDQYRAKRRIRENSRKYHAVTFERQRFWRNFTAKGMTSAARTILRKAGRLV